MSEPLVSIVVPTYNGERFLRPALRSALEQSHRNIEVVVGDDASTDRTPEILAAVAASDPRVRVIRHEANLGALDNWSYVLDAARGEYVKFLLHDDVLATDCVRDLLRGMQSSAGISIAFSRRSLINEDGRPIPGQEFPLLMDRPGTIDGRELGDTVLEQCGNIIGEVTTVLFRRSDVDLAGVWQVGGRDLDVLSDLKLFLQLLARGSAFYSPRVLSRFRRHPGQATFNPRLIARGVRDWPLLIDWGVRHGFLTEPNQQRRAYAKALQMAAARVGQLVTDPDCGPSLEAVHVCTARLVELQAGIPVDPGAPLLRRAHEHTILGRFRQELDVWTRQYPVALAAPGMDPAEIGATVQALRDVLAAGVAKKLVVAVPQPLLAQAVPLLETALGSGSDVDVELVPAHDPARLLAEPWLAVAPQGSAWHKGRATAVWTFDAPTTSPVP